MKDDSYKNYLLAVLAVILAFNFVDRLALGLLLQSIKVDLALSDTQLGVLSGIAFALFYSVMGIPIARWADRGNRVTIIALTAFVWSVAVALCGAAPGFVQLLLIRVGVGVGEAGCIPPAHSLIADHFPRAERPRAFARYMLGGPLSDVIGYFLAGWLNQIYGWRETFVFLGLPGLGLALLAWATLREPRLRESAVGLAAARVVRTPAESPAASLKDVYGALHSNRSFRHLLLCFAIASFFGVGIAQWKPAFFMRSYQLDTSVVGSWFAGIYGVGGLLGTYIGGTLASRYAVDNERLQLRAMAIAYVSFALISICIYLAPNQYVAFGFLTLATIGYYMTYGPFFATIQTLVPERMRATAIALIFLFANFVGMGLGPLAAGALSDLFRPWAGDESLRYALLTLSPGYLWGAWHLWRASRTVTHDLNALRLMS